MRLLARGAAAVAAATLVPVLGASAAHADTGHPDLSAKVKASCPHNGKITAYDRCAKTSHGVVEIHAGKRDGGVTVMYRKTSGKKVKGKIGYARGGKNHWGKTQWLSSSVIAEKDFKISKKTCKSVTGILYAGGTTFTTPPAKTC
ncbi:hypothetical protein [Streptomyces sp. ODS28]|uniref:hypothetical protein n=1 Tax=Streptomyces sp. ODS28 TaxID=3136688 RepID=UPI0031EDABA3